MTAPTPNAALAWKVMDHIDVHPELWDQGVWIGQAECGTVGCFAGWAVMLSGYTVNDAVVIESPVGATNLDGRHIESAADALLGIDDATAYEYGDLYDGLLKRGELGDRVELIFGPRPEPAPEPVAPINEVDDSLSEGDDIVYAPCQPIGCDNGHHLPGCVYAEVDEAVASANRALIESLDDVPPNAGSAS